VQRLDNRKRTIAAALCLIAIAVAVYMGVATFTQPKLAYPADFAKYGPSGPPDARRMPPGSTPHSR
jgi:hypothetical protein